MLRPEVFEIVQDLALADNITMSKTCGILVEAALAQRSLWDQNTRSRIKPEMTEDATYKSVTREDIIESVPETHTKELVQKNTVPSTKTEDLDLDPEMLALVKKLKTLKALDLL